MKSSSVLALLAFIITLGLLVFVHEAGHFIVARRAGMAIEEFGFGFPPRLIGVQRVRGRWRVCWGKGDGDSIPHPPSTRSSSTIYSLNWIPLGGFVRIRGENGGDASDPKSFAAKPWWQRAIVLVAGVGMNLVLAVVLFSAVAVLGAPQVIEGGVPAEASVRDSRARIVGVLKDGPAAKIGIQPGDAIIAINDQVFTDVAPIQQYIRDHADEELNIVTDRNGEQKEFRVRPALLPEVDRPGLGVQLVQTGIVSFPVHRAIWYGLNTTGNVIREIIASLGVLIRGLVAERRVAIDVAGPVGIAVMTGQVVRLGFVYLLQFAAVLSANLALLNVFPFPALDGGRLFILFIEAIRRRALAKKIENAIHAVGYAALLALVVAVTYHDIVTFGGGMLKTIRSVVGF